MVLRCCCGVNDVDGCVVVANAEIVINQYLSLNETRVTHQCSRPFFASTLISFTISHTTPDVRNAEGHHGLHHSTVVVDVSVFECEGTEYSPVESISEPSIQLSHRAPAEKEVKWISMLQCDVWFPNMEIGCGGRDRLLHSQ
jgi:hypothetical protein